MAKYLDIYSSYTNENGTSSVSSGGGYGDIDYSRLLLRRGTPDISGTQTFNLSEYTYPMIKGFFGSNTDTIDILSMENESKVETIQYNKDGFIINSDLNVNGDIIQNGISLTNKFWTKTSTPNLDLLTVDSNGNLIVPGNIVAFGDKEYLESIFDNLPIASTTSLGIAQFNSTQFSVENGLVRIIKAGLDENELQAYLTNNKYAKESWVLGKNYLTEHQSLSGYATQIWVLNKNMLKANLTGGNTFTGTQVFNGDIIQNGSAYETHSEQVFSTNDLFILRDKAISGLEVGKYSGFVAKIADGVKDSIFGFDKTGMLKVGKKGSSFQTIATREDNITDGHGVVWNSSKNTFIDAGYKWSNKTGDSLVDFNAKSFIEDGQILSAKYWTKTSTPNLDLLKIDSNGNLVVPGNIVAFGDKDYLTNIIDNLPIASTTSLGIAQFNSTQFSVENGIVRIIKAGLDESELSTYLTNNKYAKESWIESKNYLTTHQSLSGYYTKTVANNTFAYKSHTHSQYLTTHQSLSNYIKKVDTGAISIESTSGSWWQKILTQDSATLSTHRFQFLERQGSGVYKELFGVDGYGNLFAKDSKVATEKWVLDKKYLTTHQSLANYALKNHTHIGLSTNSWGGIRSQTSAGYIDFGPANGSHAHIYTDRDSFYFNKEMYVNGHRMYHTGYKPTYTDVGAAPLVHTHDDRYYIKSESEERYMRVNRGRITDFNKAFTVGTYQYDMALNRPTAYGTLMNILNSGTSHNNTNNWLTQLAFGTGGEFNIRQKTNAATFSAWQRVYTTGYKPTAADVNAYAIQSGIAIQYNNEINSNTNSVLHLGYRNTTEVKLAYGGGAVRIGKGVGFFSGDASYTKFSAGNFYLTTDVPTFYNYAKNTYHGNTSGCNQFFRGNNLIGNKWSIDSVGSISSVNISATGSINVSGKVNANGGLSQDGNVILNGSDTWLRTTGATGWYSSTYGGGWYMEDSTYVRTYGSKSIRTERNVSAGGSITAAKNITAYSDMRLKDYIKPLTSVLTNIDKLSTFYYDWKDKKTFGEELNIGLSAQDVNELYPELVNKEEIWSLDYGKLGAIISVKGLQEVKHWMSKSDKRILELENEIVKLKNKIL